MYQIELCLYLFILQNTNRLISSIINEIPTTFWLMQMFEVTVKNACFVLHLHSSDLTENVHMYTPSLTLPRMLATPQGYLSITDTGFTRITFLTLEVFSISKFFIFHSSMRTLPVQFQCVYVFSDTRGIINNSILWTLPHIQMTFSLTKFWPREINKSSWFSFSTKIVSCYFPISIPKLLYWITTIYVSHSFCTKHFGFTPVPSPSIFFNLSVVFIYPLLNRSPWRKKCKNICFVGIKEITALHPLQRAPTWNVFQIDQISFFHVNVLRRRLYSPSQIFSLHHKTQCPLHLYISPGLL